MLDGLDVLPIGGKMRILTLTRWYPYPTDNGARLRVFNLLKFLSKKHILDLIALDTREVGPEDIQAMRMYCQNISVCRLQPYDPGNWKAVLGYLSPAPRSVVQTYSQEMKQTVEQACANHSYDVVYAIEPDTAPYARNLPVKVKVLDDLEVAVMVEQFTRAGSLTAKFKRGLTWLKTAQYYRNMIRDFNGVTVVSDREYELVSRLTSGTTAFEIVPNGVDIAAMAGEFGSPEPDTLIYSGALTYDANYNAVEYFLKEIFPLIRKQRPQVRLYLTGKNDGVDTSRLPLDDQVNLTGWLSDIRPRIAQSWVSVVPLRIGAGTRLKILESLALGTPVVSTTKGAEGLQLSAGRDLMIADTPQAFAQAVLDILEDKGKRLQLATTGKETACALYDWPNIVQKLENFIGNLVQAHR